MSTELDAVLKDAASVTDDELRTLSLDSEVSLLEAIMAEPTPEPRRRGAFALRRVPRRRLLARAVVGAAAAAAIALIGVSLTNDGGVQTGPDHAWGAEALAVAGAVPRLLIEAPGWEVIRADEFTVAEGKLTFENASEEVQLTWVPARARRQRRAAGGMDPATGADRYMTRLDDVDVRGHRAALFRSLPPNVRFFTATWRMGKYSFELTLSAQRGDSDLTSTQFEQLVRSLRPVTVDEWLSAMPALVVLPAARKATVHEMLSDLPLPPGFDVRALEAGRTMRDRYQLGARVVGAVMCAWVGLWVDARKAGDNAATRAALDAVEGWRDWAVLDEMKAEGGEYHFAVQYTVDMMAGRWPTEPGDTVEDLYREVERTYREGFCYGRG